MSDPSERRSTFENFAFNASREALQGYSEQEIVDILGAEFWRGVFPPNTVGWDIRAWLRGITPDEYPPEKLPAFFWQPKSHQIFISKRGSGDGGRASLPGAGNYPEDYPDLVDLRVHHEPDLPHQTPVDRRKAFDDLCLIGEPIAINLLG